MESRAAAKKGCPLATIPVAAVRLRLCRALRIRGLKSPATRLGRPAAPGICLILPWEKPS